MQARNADANITNEFAGKISQQSNVKNVRPAYCSPEIAELGKLRSVQATSYGKVYDGWYTTRSWYHN